jgi:6,7-dimethyl-8-ribityllumazine synthase
MIIIHADAINSESNSAIVVSRFNEDITNELLKGATDRLLELGLKNSQITIARVPGAVEIPITAQGFAQTKKYNAIIALGAVIYGETAHFEYVCQQATQGCQTFS